MLSCGLLRPVAAAPHALLSVFAFPLFCIEKTIKEKHEIAGLSQQPDKARLCNREQSLSLSTSRTRSHESIITAADTTLLKVETKETKATTRTSNKKHAQAERV